jgi:hypothetical protein
MRDRSLKQSSRAKTLDNSQAAKMKTGGKFMPPVDHAAHAAMS